MNNKMNNINNINHISHMFIDLLTNSVSSAKQKYFYCKITKNIKTICSQIWIIRSKTHQGSCHARNIQTCNNEKELQTPRNLRNKPKLKANQLN
jgi:hypothetical protein